jgi:DegV family protein with EDD domain
MTALVSTAVVTDTTAYLPQDLIVENGIHLASLYVTLDGEQKRESEISGAKYDDFYERLSRSEGGATTSQPSVGDFVEIYEPLLADGGEVVSLHISSGISGTYGSALQARQQLVDSGGGGERIRVWDSRSGCGGQGMMALLAAKTAAGGASADETMAEVERARESLKMWFAIDTLEYLRKGGRIGAAQAFLGSALQIKPILTLEEEITPIESAHAAGPSSGWSSSPTSARTPAPPPGSSNTSMTPTPRASWSTSAARSSATIRSSSPRSGP